MRIQSQPNFQPLRNLPTPPRAPQGETLLGPGDSWVPSKPTAVSVGASLGVLGAAAGVYAGLSNGLLSSATGAVLRVAGGAVGGALIGAGIASMMDPRNEWSGFKGATYGCVPGALAGGVYGALASASPTSAVLLGIGGALAGGALGAYLAQD